MKRLAIAFCFGIATTLASGLYCGPDALINVGVRWREARRDFIVYAEPVRDMDESMVANVLAEPVKSAPKRVVKR